MKTKVLFTSLLLFLSTYLPVALADGGYAILDKPPPPGHSGVYHDTENGGQKKKKELFAHRKHPPNDQALGVKKANTKKNRKDALAGIPKKTGFARDEKPPNILVRPTGNKGVTVRLQIPKLLGQATERQRTLSPHDRAGQRAEAQLPQLEGGRLQGRSQTELRTLPSRPQSLHGTLGQGHDPDHRTAAKGQAVHPRLLEGNRKAKADLAKLGGNSLYGTLALKGGRHHVTLALKGEHHHHGTLGLKGDRQLPSRQHNGGRADWLQKKISRFLGYHHVTHTTRSTQVVVIG
ncbi:hypothetical protein M413DRAFT_10993 [Hebeloma cylindrosporum]|uniref:Uncharacterized protein n=1 Tax=Hebeloma cylindrosporum TaxID=76867 RepID=A0A0C2YK24_HEBCY|nr:hypothetical protein M413DRAFT_10993 [Hebeloma cylindrosporum h7]